MHSEVFRSFAVVTLHERNLALSIMPSEKGDFPDETRAPHSAANPVPGGAEGGMTEADVQSAATEYFETLTEAASRLTEQAREMYRISHSFASDHPAAFIAGAFGLGVLLGVLFDRD